VIAAAGAVAALAPRPGPERRGAVVAAVLGVLAFAVPVLLGLVGLDYVIARNELPAWLPLMTVVAAGLVRRPAGPAGLAVLAVIGLVAVVGVWHEPRWQRENWRGMAQALPAPKGPRAIILPALGSRPLRLYIPHLDKLPQAGVPVREIALVYPVRRQVGKVDTLPPPHIPTPRYGAFQLVERRETDSYSLVLMRAPRPERFGVASALSFIPSKGEPTAVLLQP
jgi:hypothetical protein